MNQTLNGIRRILITILVAMGVGALFIIAIGENPIDAYAALFRGAFDGKLRLGTTLAGFTPLLLTSIAFAVAAKAGAFNVGVEGEFSWAVSQLLILALTGPSFRSRLCMWPVL